MLFFDIICQKLEIVNGKTAFFGIYRHYLRTNSKKMKDGPDKKFILCRFDNVWAII